MHDSNTSAHHPQVSKYLQICNRSIVDAYLVRNNSNLLVSSNGTIEVVQRL